MPLCLEEEQLFMKKEKWAKKEYRVFLKWRHQNRFDLENICRKNNKQSTLFIVFSQRHYKKKSWNGLYSSGCSIFSIFSPIDINQRLVINQQKWFWSNVSLKIQWRSLRIFRLEIGWQIRKQSTTDLVWYCAVHVLKN